MMGTRHDRRRWWMRRESATPNAGTDQAPAQGFIRSVRSPAQGRRGVSRPDEFVEASGGGHACGRKVSSTTAAALAERRGGHQPAHDRARAGPNLGRGTIRMGPGASCGNADWRIVASAVRGAATRSQGYTRDPNTVPRFAREVVAPPASATGPAAAQVLPASRPVMITRQHDDHGPDPVWHSLYYRLPGSAPSSSRAAHDLHVTATATRLAMEHRRHCGDAGSATGSPTSRQWNGPVPDC
jgi:hypothetical protein